MGAETLWKYLCVACTLAIATLHGPSSAFANITMEQKLKRYLFLDNFDPTVRPVQNSTHNVTVWVDLSLNHLVDLSWYDPQLTWNSSEYGNVKAIHVPAGKIWLPDIVIYNEVGMETGKDPKEFLMKIYENGNVQWNFPRTIETSCKMDVYYFPFDSQNCLFTFGSWTFSGSLLDVRTVSGHGDSAAYVDNGEWILRDILAKRQEIYYVCCPDDPYPDVTFTLVLQRRYLYYVYNLIGPCLVITFLHLTAFLLPAESGEKISLNVTILLGLTVFLLLVAEIMPPQSEVIPVVGQYFGICICFIALSTILSVFILHLHFRGSRGFPLPPWVRNLIISKLGYILCYGSLIEKTAKKQGISKEKKPARKSVKPMMNGSTQVSLVSVRATTGTGSNGFVPNGADANLPDNTSEMESEDLPPVNIESYAKARSTIYRHDNYVLSTEGKPPMEDLGVLHRHIEDKEEVEKAVIQDWILVSLILDRFCFIVLLAADVAAAVFVLSHISRTGT